MSVRKKGRRKIVVNQTSYIWYVVEDQDSSDNELHVISDDKQLIVQFHLGQREDLAYIIVIGKQFCGVSDTGGSWRRFRCPKWDIKGFITPKTIASLINWCMLETKDLIEVDCYGAPMPLNQPKMT